MAKIRLLLSVLCIFTILLYEACSSGKSAYEQGNYYQSVITSVNRLRRNDDHKKSVETLRQAYPLAVKYYEDEANKALATNDQFKWSKVVQSYTTINSMYDEIRRSPGALKVIPNPVNYHDKLSQAKQNAAEENYAAGVLALSVGTRDKAKQAYQYFKTADGFVPAYKEVNDMMEEALWVATVKVMIEPIPAVSRNVAISAEFFNDKVSEYLHSASINEYVRFFTLKEAQTINLKPDHVIQLSFDDFAIGQVYKHEKEIQLVRDSVVVATYITPNQNVANTSNVAPVTTPTKPGETTGTQPTTPDANTNTPTTPPTGNTTQNNSGNQTNSGSQTSGTGQTSNTGTTGTPVTTTPPANTNTQPSGSTGTQTTTPSKPTTPGNTNTQTQTPSTPKVEEEPKVTICHIPPGNAGNAHTLVVPQSALQAHLAHGDALGFCDDSKSNQNKNQETKPGQGNDKDKTTPGSGKKGGSGQSFIQYSPQSLVASAGPYIYLDQPDTNKVYATVKATLFHFQKTVTSKGLMNFRIVDNKTSAVLSAEKMPGEYVWVSEWAYFNGDERALTKDQLAITQQKEQTPPDPQQMFIGFTSPMFDQLLTRINTFYKGY